MAKLPKASKAAEEAGIKPSLTDTQARGLGKMVFALFATMDSGELIESTPNKEIIGLIGFAQKAKEPEKPAPVALSSVVTANANYPARTLNLADRLRDEREIREAKRKYGENYADPEERQMMDQAEAQGL